MEDKKLFLLDAYALIYRAYYGLASAPRFTADGRNTSAIFGFCNTLHEVLRREDPPYMAVCFDPPGGHTFRHDMFPDYKAQRDKQPEDITLAIPYIKDILQAMGIAVVEVAGYEADDVIGTLAHQAAARGFDTYMMTLDKDYGQLVDNHTFMYRPALKGRDFEVRGPQQVCERHGISSPRQVIDLLALEGDASDNIPGCPGVGEKTAVKLIAQYHDIDNMLAHASDIPGALGRKIRDNRDSILLARDLVTIRTDVPTGTDPGQLQRREPNLDRLRQIYTDLQFKTFLAKLEERPPAPAAAAETQMSLFDDAADTVKPAPGIDIVTAPDRVATLLGEARTSLGLCMVTDNGTAMTARWLGVALCPDGVNSVAWLDVRATPLTLLQELLTPALNNPAVKVVSNDIKRDLLILRRHGIELTAPVFDTSVAHYTVDADGRHDTDTLAATCLDTATAVPGDETLTACNRARAQCLLVQPLLDAADHDGVRTLLDDIEMPMVRVLADMEWTGVRVDTHTLAQLSAQLTQRLNDMERECHAMAGVTFNPGSPTQVGEVLFDRLKIDPKAKRTKRGAWSTAEDVLESYRHDWPIVDLILRIRGLRKLLGTYIDTLPTLIDPRDGKIHTTFNQTVTSTGRISSTNPNLQNIPIRTPEGKRIRQAFVADPGNLILSADYSQIELRLMAAMSGDEAMIQDFAHDSDIHRATAAKIYGTDPAGVTDIQRRNAKTANFGIIYGISAFGLSQRLGIPRTEAKDLIDGYLKTYPGVARYMDRAIEQARADGMVTTIHGRRRYLKDINSRSAVMRGYAERNAVNAPLQGSAADIIKIAMVGVDREIKRLGLKSRMILQVHDELVFDVVPDELATLQSLVTRIMEGAYSGPVRLTVSSGVGQNWLDAH